MNTLSSKSPRLNSTCAKKPSTAIDTNAAKLAAIRDVGLIAAKSRVQQVPRNPAERKGSYYVKFLDELAGFDVDAAFAFDPTTASPEWKSHDDWTDFTTRPRMLSKLEMQNAKVVQARRVIDARVERTRDDANRRGGVHKIGIHKIKEPVAARLARSVKVSLWIVHAAEERPPDDVEPTAPRLVSRVAVPRAPRPEERP